MSALTEFRAWIKPGMDIEITNHYISREDHPCYGTRTAHIDKVNSASYYLDGSQWPSKFPKASQIKRDETGAFLIYGGGASQKSDELFLTIQSGKGNDDA